MVSGKIIQLMPLFMALLSCTAHCAEMPNCKGNYANLISATGVKFSTDPETIEKAIRPLWNPSRLSDPASHNPDDFIYIVRIGGIYDEYFNGVRIDPRKKMLSVVQRPNYVSASLIGNRPTGTKFIGTYARGLNGNALILKVPPSQIHVAIPQDTGRIAMSDSGAPSLANLINDERRRGVYSPEEMLSKSVEIAKSRNREATHYNEILFVGSKDVEIIGVAQFGDDTEAAQKVARDLGGVPVVKIR